jgi:hypothetical protein
MQERTSRSLFIAELVVFALPSIAFLVTYAVLIGGWSLFAMVVVSVSGLTSLPDTAKGAWSTLQPIALFGGAAAAAIAGLIAVGIFTRIATDFVWHGRAALAARHAAFYRGLLWAIVPFAVMIAFVWRVILLREPAGAIVGFYLSGLALAVPILHLWIELRLQRAAVPSVD